MSVIAQFLTTPSQAGSAHPLIRSWGWLLRESTGDARCRVERRRQGLAYGQTKLWLRLTLKTGEPRDESSDWDGELNRWLIGEKVKAEDEENEAVRFQLVLRELLQKTAIRLGDGFFSAVLIEVLRTTGLADEPRIAHILTKVGQYEPYRGGDTYLGAVETIKAALSTCARWLQELGYGEEAVLNILVWAIVHYLDDRFSVTNRAMLGMA